MCQAPVTLRRLRQEGYISSQLWEMLSQKPTQKVNDRHWPPSWLSSGVQDLTVQS